MINILFLAFEFPPLNRGGVHRALGFVKWLPKFGINPVVVTLDESSYENVFDTYSYDESLGAEVRKSASVVSIQSASLKDQNRAQRFISIYFSLSGNEVRRWKENYFATLPQIMDKYKPTCILATLPPFSMIPLASKTASDWRLPLILDFRDAWSQWRTLPFGTRMHYWANLKMERKYLEFAEKIIATSEQTLEDFKKIHSELPVSKFHYIPNGYDGNLNKWKPVDPGKKNLLIGYVGSFYYTPEAREQMLKPWWKKRGHRMLQYIPQKQDWLYRSPYFFFRVLRYISEHFSEQSKKVKVVFVGKKPKWLEEMVREFGLDQQVELAGMKSHQEALDFQKQCDMLLITSAKRLGGLDYSIAGKTFEYIQAQKPILAFVPDGAQKAILQETGMALICDPDNEKESAEKMIDLMDGEIQLMPQKNFIESLSREELTRKLALIIEDASRKQRP